MHEHDYYSVEFSWGGYWECRCGHRPTEEEWDEWKSLQPAWDRDYPEGEQSNDNE